MNNLQSTSRKSERRRHLASDLRSDRVSRDIYTTILGHTVLNFWNIQANLISKRFPQFDLAQLRPACNQPVEVYARCQSRISDRQVWSRQDTVPSHIKLAFFFWVISMVYGLSGNFLACGWQNFKQETFITNKSLLYCYFLLILIVIAASFSEAHLSLVYLRSTLMILATFLIIAGDIKLKFLQC
jgi:hypothetical protein